MKMYQYECVVIVSVEGLLDLNGEGQESEAYDAAIEQAQDTLSHVGFDRVSLLSTWEQAEEKK